MVGRILAIAILVCAVAGWSPAEARAAEGKIRLAVVGLDHDHIWGLFKDILGEPDAELVAIAEPNPALVARAKKQVPAKVKFYREYTQMLDEAKPDAVIVTTANNRHLEILKACAQRHINFFTEKPLAATGADAREMERVAAEAGIKVMVNYWNQWAPATHEAFARITAGEIGPVYKMIIEFGHQGPKEIGVSKEFEEWLYDPTKNGAGALMDFGCYGADWAIWLKGKPQSVYATSLTLKTAQHNRVEDDATVLLQYPDATVVLLPSWDWPYSKGQAEFFGAKGSLLVMGDGLLLAKHSTDAKEPEGKPVESKALPPYMKNGVAFYVHCLKTNKPIAGPISAKVNVGVVEIIDAAKESIKTGRAVELK